MKRTRTMPWAAAACLLWGAAGSGWPCSLGERQLVLPLQRGAAQLGAANARALSEWLIQWRDGGGGIESLIVVAPALPTGRRLAQERLRHTARLVGALGAGQAPVTYEVEPRPAGFNDQKYLDSLDVSVQPACLRAGTCCQVYRPPASP